MGQGSSFSRRSRLAVLAKSEQLLPNEYLTKIQQRANCCDYLKEFITLPSFWSPARVHAQGMPPRITRNRLLPHFVYGCAYMLRTISHLREFVNYRHPDPRRGEPRVCSTQLDAFTEDPVDPVQNSGRLILKHLSRSFSTFGRKMGTHFDTKALSLRP